MGLERVALRLARAGDVEPVEDEIPGGLNVATHRRDGWRGPPWTLENDCARRSRTLKVAPMKLAPLLVWAVITLASCFPVRAGSRLETTSHETSQFDSGRHEFQIGTGVFVSFQTTSAMRPQINDAGGNLRFGWMLSSPSGEGFWRGNTELLVAAQGSWIVEGPGNVFAGGSLILRRNFVQPASRWVPYGQIEAGALYNNGYQDQTQHALDQAFEFQIGAGIGIRYLCNDGWAIFGEADYRHISNAGLADRNAGTNAVGCFIGISRLF